MDCRNVVTYKYTPQPQNKTNSCLLMKIMSTTIEASFLNPFGIQFMSKNRLDCVLHKSFCKQITFDATKNQ